MEILLTAIQKSTIILSLAIVSLCVHAENVSVSTTVADDLVLNLNDLSQLGFQDISNANKSSSSSQTHSGVLAYTTAAGRGIAMNISTIPAGITGGNPVLHLLPTSQSSVKLPAEQTEIPFTIEYTSCHDEGVTPQKYTLLVNTPQIIPATYAQLTSCLTFPGFFNGLPGSLTFTRLPITGPLPEAGTYESTVIFTISLA